MNQIIVANEFCKELQELIENFIRSDSSPRTLTSTDCLRLMSTNMACLYFFLGFLSGPGDFSEEEIALQKKDLLDQLSQNIETILSKPTS